MLIRRLLAVALAAAAVLALAAALLSHDATGRGWDGFAAGHWPGAQWRPYAPSSPFNTRISRRDRVHPRSARMVRRVLEWGAPASYVAGLADTSADYGHPVYFSTRKDPFYRLHATMPWGHNRLEGRRIRIPAAARAAAGTDHHLTVVTPDGWEYDFWRVRSKHRGRLTFGWGGRLRVDGSGLRAGGTAAQFGALAGVIRASELAAGRIDHALFIVLRCTSNSAVFRHGVRRHAPRDLGSSYVYPASKGGAPCYGPDNRDVPPMGAHFALAMSDRQIAALALPRWKKAILTALAHYGGYVGDTGGPGFGLMFESGSTYTSFGASDPMVAFARDNKLPRKGGGYVLDIGDDVDWTHYLRVLLPRRR